MSDHHTERPPSVEQLFDDVSQTFWVVFLFYVIASFSWIMYCCYIHRIELRLVDKKIEKNRMARAQELQRLLEAYNRVTVAVSASASSSASSSSSSDHPSIEQV